MKIVILGGGTAGWMAANLFAKNLQEKNVSITLVESPELGSVGVGEGSTPQLVAFFRSIGVEESEWMPACNATYKLGIRFNHWSTHPEYESYFHPFPAKVDHYSSNVFIINAALRRQGLDVDAHPDGYFLNTFLAESKRSPLPHKNFPFPVEYGYHFDSYLLGRFLNKLAVAKSVVHKQGLVKSVLQNNHGDISGLLLNTGEAIYGDLFIDASGFSGVLLQQALKVPFHLFRENLFNDSAVVMPTLHSVIPKPQTVSTALKYGWAWSIPLSNRMGNGYVYSSDFCGGDQAETELRTHLGCLEKDINVRHLKMKVGRVAHHWYKNCLGVGLAQGFIEPLEATALHLIQYTIEKFIEEYQAGQCTDLHRKRFNQAINDRFEGIRDYIVCHYRLSSRTDSEYWRANAANENLSPQLKHMIKSWLSRANLRKEVKRLNIDRFYSHISWHCIFSGYGIFPVLAESGCSLSIDNLVVKEAMDAALAQRDFLSICSEHYNRCESHNERFELHST